MGIFELPEGYSEIKRINLQKDKKLAVLVNIGAVIIAIALFFLGLFIVPFEITIKGDVAGILLSPLPFFLSIILYLLSHELIHGLFIKKYSGKRARYGFTGLYAYAGSDAFFNKRQYIIIALAPVVLWGAVFLLLNIFLPVEFFWSVYFLQIINLSGAAGDFYITLLVIRLPADILTNDEGVAMVIYSRAE